MPSYEQLDDEAAWRAEFEPPALKALAAGCRAHWAGCGVWIRGDNNHDSGYHRSRRWIKESRFCDNRTYSVSRTAGDRSGGDSNWACGFDLGNLPQSELLAACQRLDAAIRAGLLEKVNEWYGNINGDQRVDGYDNIANRLASSDSSHLFHLHMGFDRGRADEDHSDVLAILTGEDMDTAITWNSGWMLQRALLEDADQIVIPANSALGATGASAPNHIKRHLLEIKAKLTADETRDAVMLVALQGLAGNGGPEVAPIIAAINARADAMQALVAEQHQAEMAELGALHLAALREREAELAAAQATIAELQAAAGA